MIANDTFWSYLAGFFDGEGCCGLMHKGGNSFYRKIDQSGPAGKLLLDSIAQVFVEQCGLRGKVRVRESNVPPNNLIKKPKYPKQYWYLLLTHRESVLFVLRKIIGYLHIKKTLAQDILRYGTIFPKSRPGEKRRAERTCVRGHSYLPNNVYYYRCAGGKIRRQCKTCKKVSDRAYHQSRKGVS